MSALSVPSSDFRALEQFDTIPAGCTGMVITSDRFAPHLRPGEIAVVNPNDKDPVSGELFVIAFDRLGERVSRIVQTVSRECHDRNLRPWIGWYDRFEFKRPGEMVFVDGPMRAKAWSAKRCVGRIVGFVAPEWEWNR